MVSEQVSFRTVDGSTVAAAERPGITGKGCWRTFEQGNIRSSAVAGARLFIVD